MFGDHPYVVYRITSPSGKVYIGITKNVYHRFQAYKYRSSSGQVILYNSLEKYGWDNHLKEIIEDNLSKKEASRLEIEWISFYKTKSISLNICDGGYGGMNLIGEFHPAARPVLQFDEDGNFIKRWDTLTEAGNSFSLSRGDSNITNAANCGNIRAYGFQWRFENDPRPVEKFTNYAGKFREIKIVQLSRSGDYINTFESVKSAAEITGIQRANISRTINRKIGGVAGGYMWCKKSDYDKGNIPSYKQTQGSRYLNEFRSTLKS